MTDRMRLVPVEATTEMGAAVSKNPAMNGLARRFYSVMLAAAPGVGNVPRAKLREGLDAADVAFCDAMAGKMPLPENLCAAEEAAENALAAALGLEVEG